MPRACRSVAIHSNWKIRLDRAAWEMAQGKRYDHYVINDRLDNCVEEILKIIAEATEAN